MKSLKMCWKTNSQKKKFQKDVKKSRANNPNFEYSLDFVACRLAAILGLENELDRSTLDDFFEIFLNYEEAIRTIQAKEFRYHKKIIRAYSRNAYKNLKKKLRQIRKISDLTFYGRLFAHSMKKVAFGEYPTET